MDREIELAPDRRNYKVGWVLFGGLAAAAPVIALYQGRFVEAVFGQGAILASLFMLAVPAAINLWSRTQRMLVGPAGIQQKIFEQFRLREKIFTISEVEYFKYESGCLVVKSKKGPYPKFPTGLLADLSGVIIVSPLFSHSHQTIIQFLSKNGIPKC